MNELRCAERDAGVSSRDENARKKCTSHRNDAIPNRTRLMSGPVTCRCLRDRRPENDGFAARESQTPLHVIRQRSVLMESCAPVKQRAIIQMISFRLYIAGQ
jgi:hypothetical protein